MELVLRPKFALATLPVTVVSPDLRARPEINITLRQNVRDLVLPSDFALSLPVLTDIKPPTCMELVLRPQFALANLPVTVLSPGLRARPDFTLRRNVRGLVLPSKFALSLPVLTDLGSTYSELLNPRANRRSTRTSQSLRPKPTFFIATPDPRVHAVQEKMALRIKIREECKNRVIKAAKALKNAWKRDSKYRRWAKVMKQAEKALQNAEDKIYEIRREEDRIWAEIDKIKESS